jgi:succinyl-CoA synthetase beta subunit
MNIHEYQAKQVLKKYGVPTSHGVVALKADDIDDLLNNFNADLMSLKPKFTQVEEVKLGELKLLETRKMQRK